jgi:flavin-dependent dehydrogenase
MLALPDATELETSVIAAATLPQASARVWDVAVVGAGPAGSFAAFSLARAGASVLLLDKDRFPRYKVCGCCLNRRALAALAASGLGDLPRRLGAVPLRAVRLAAQGRRASALLPGGAVLSRQAFDSALVEAAISCGAVFCPGTRASPGEAVADHRQLTLRHGESVAVAKARVVVAADGLSGGLLAEEGARVTDAHSRLGAGTIVDHPPNGYMRGTIYLACDRGGYVGLVRLEDDRLDIAAALDAEFVKSRGGLAQAAACIIDCAGLPPIPSLTRLPWRGTPLLTQKAVRPAGERVFAIGDSAGYVEPFTGEGIAWALSSAAAVAPFALEASRRWIPGLSKQWTVCYAQTIARRQGACRLVAGVLRRPWLTRGIIGVLAHAPGLASPLIGYLNRP